MVWTTLCEVPGHNLKVRDTTGGTPSKPYVIWVWYNILFSSYSYNADVGSGKRINMEMLKRSPFSLYRRREPVFLHQGGVKDIHYPRLNPSYIWHQSRGSALQQRFSEGKTHTLHISDASLRPCTWGCNSIWLWWASISHTATTERQQRMYCVGADLRIIRIWVLADALRCS